MKSQHLNFFFQLFDCLKQPHTLINFGLASFIGEAFDFLISRGFLSSVSKGVIIIFY